jgi:hypothetical protein
MMSSEIRDISELENIQASEWSMDELANHHHSMSQMIHFLNAEGVSFHNTIIKEIERRGGVNAR